MVDESRRLTGRELPEGKVVREAYIALHIRVAKALDADFDVESSKNAANSDWAEDITAFSGDDAASVWLEEVKTKFVEVAGVASVARGTPQRGHGRGGGSACACVSRVCPSSGARAAAPSRTSG